MRITLIYVDADAATSGVKTGTGSGWLYDNGRAFQVDD